MFDTIQNQALEICIGTPKYPNTDALKVELHEPPLALSRTQHQIESTAKCKAEARDNIDLHLDIGQIIMAPLKTTEGIF